MPKRKRGSTDGHEPSDGPSPRMREIAVRVIAISEKHVNRALKVGKGFERQKLAKRLKIAPEKGDDGLERRLNSEVEALKTLDLASVAAHHLRKSLLKNKAIASSPALPFGEKDINPISHNAATLNVTARLYSSNPVQTATGRAIEDVIRALGVATSSTSRDKYRLSRTTASTSPSEGMVDHRDSGVSHVSDKADDIPSNDRSLAKMGNANSTSPVPLETKDDLTDEDEYEGFARLDQRIASSSELSDTEGDSHIDTTQSRNLEADSDSADLSLSQPSSPNALSLPSTFPQYKSKANQKPRSNQSAFLPSLTMGGYISGSESGSNDDVDVAPARRNRRGQRARQQIWKKKYGNNANHLQKQKQDLKTGDRNKGWDPRRGAVEDESGGYLKRKRERGWRKRGPTDANAIQVSNSRARFDDRAGPQQKEKFDRPLHPSWEAKKRAKEQQKQTASFQGTKITFD